MIVSSVFSVDSFYKPQKSGRGVLLVHKIVSPLTQCYSYASTNNVSQRKSANYQPNLWNYDFLQSLKHEHDYAADIRDEKRARKLQEEMRRMITDEKVDIWITLEVIDDVRRLGLSYQFEKEIKETLHRFLISSERISGTTIIQPSLHETALSFRLLRDYGFHVSADVFERFKDHKGGNFKDSLCKDVKGMLSLYEASFLSYEREYILDEANAFTSFHLRDLKDTSNSIHLLQEVNHAMELPQHRRIERLEARWYIESYKKRKNPNMLLLEAAKLDFNIVQSTLQNDLTEMARWWKELGLASKLSFSRDRLMECFFWTVGMAYEPEHSDLRKGLTKVISLITIIDDIYDVYGTFEELELFTTVVESWDIKAICVLPEYMKICFLALYNIVNEFVYDILKEQGQDILPYLIKAWSDLLKAFLQEAKWSRDKHLPKFDEYLNNAWVSSSGVVLLTHAYFLLNPNITKEALHSLNNSHPLFRTPSTIFRLSNDLATSRVEMERGEVECLSIYMGESGVSEEDAYRDVLNLLNVTWKKLNKDRATQSIFSKSFVEIAINLARIAHCTYQYGDGHGAPDSKAKNRIQSLIIEPIALGEMNTSLLLDSILY